MKTLGVRRRMSAPPTERNSIRKQASFAAPLFHFREKKMTSSTSSTSTLVTRRRRPTVRSFG